MEDNTTGGSTTMSRTVKGFVNYKMNDEVYKNKQKIHIYTLQK